MERIVPPRPSRTWRDHLRAGLLWLGVALLAAYVVASFRATGFSFGILSEGMRRGSFARMGRELASPDLSWYARDRDGNVKLYPERWVENKQGERVLAPESGKPMPGTLQILLRAMNMTVMIGLLGTLLSIVFSFPLAFLAARNLTRGSPAGRVTFTVARALLNVLRAIEPIILGIIFIFIVGPGPFAGILALALHSIGSLGKLYAEAIEQVDPLPVEAVRATGASNFLTVWYGVLPQVAPQMLAFSLYRWDLNIRMSIVLGIVGAGGIGYYLQQYISLFQYGKVATALLIILAAVSLLDWASGVLREKLG